MMGLPDAVRLPETTNELEPMPGPSPRIDGIASRTRCASWSASVAPPSALAWVVGVGLAGVLSAGAEPSEGSGQSVTSASD